MKKRYVLPLALAVLAAMSACTSLDIGGLTVPLTETPGTVIGDFDIDVPIPRFLALPGGGFGLFRSRFGMDANTEINEAIKAEVANLGGSAAINVKIDWGGGFRDVLLGFLTGFVYSPVRARITGQVIK